MNSSDIPSRITKPFGVNGLRNPISTDSSTTTDSNGVATFDKGFPGVTMQPLSAGGIPPSGKDLNGVLYSATLQQQWYNAGMTYQFNADFATAVSGYPKGSIVPSSALTGQWLNLNEANSATPESSTGASTGWVPINNYGITQITLSSASVVMTSLQAAKDRIILSGTLTSNVNLIFPNWLKSWTVVNNCTGTFSVTLRTVSGTGIVTAPDSVEKIYCDGTSILRDFGSASQRNVGVLPGNIPDMSSFQSHISGAGSQTLPGGLTIKWGSGVAGANNTTGLLVNFDEPFKNSLFSIATGNVENPFGVSSSFGSIAFCSLSNSSFIAKSSTPSSDTFYYIAIGI